MKCNGLRKSFLPVRYRTYYWLPSEAQTVSRKFQPIFVPPIYGINHLTCHVQEMSDLRGDLHLNTKFLIRDTGPPMTLEQRDITCTKLSNYVIDIAKYFFTKFGIVDNPMPYIIDHNLAVTIFNLLYYEVFLMFEPEAISIDPFRLICLRGNALSKSYVLPCGTTNRSFKVLEKAHLYHCP
jgi:hypothetical protein